MMPLVKMTRAKANEILRLWKAGAEEFPQSVIRMALYKTGDLESLR